MAFYFFVQYFLAYSTRRKIKISLFDLIDRKEISLDVNGVNPDLLDKVFKLKIVFLWDPGYTIPVDIKLSP